MKPLRSIDELAHLFEQYLVGERNLAASTIAAYRYDLAKYAAHRAQNCPQEAVPGADDRDYIRGFLASRGGSGRPGERSGAYQARALAVLKAFYGFLARDGHILGDPTVGLRFPKLRQKEPGVLSEEELGRVARTIQKLAGPSCRARDIAIWVVLCGTGLRVSELVALDVGHVNFGERRLRVLRKGGNIKHVEMNERVGRALRHYLRARLGRSNWDLNRPLFPSKRSARVSSREVRHLVHKYTMAAGIERISVTPHTIRHSFATLLLRKGVDPKTVSELLGHRGLHTVARYLHTDEESRRKAVARLEVG